VKRTHFLAAIAALAGGALVPAPVRATLRSPLPTSYFSSPVFDCDSLYVVIPDSPAPLLLPPNRPMAFVYRVDGRRWVIDGDDAWWWRGEMLEHFEAYGHFTTSERGVIAFIPTFCERTCPICTGYRDG
jgi:hypothetical protein